MEKTQWLSHEQQQVWRKYLRATARVSQFLDADLRRFGLNLAEYEILVALSEADGRRMRMSDLADAVHQSRSRLTHTVTRLERDGHVSRVTCASDGRGVWAELTGKGFSLLEESAPRHVTAVRKILIDPVEPDDLQAVGRAMEAVLSVAD
ncbi:MarR family transcriptional regulator [Tessaracoccus sp. OS52]|uniref:MarR family winged helix-turn-helix transcriptional regulator n=1 Tax=Tessaracoccus sp. OS52 TaxID=2886691 RepID=UPI001D124900|nr:MarR family transcriptional regulator [Tessaracoccus sp. OS52]MCC2592425.1 MarR family transcriptional regulator [Tessaracoccus sp. OS52]